MTSLISIIKTYWLYITLVILAVITFLSLYPLDVLPPVPGNDKTHHFIAYAALMFPVALRKPKHWLLIGVFFVLWSGGIELVQPYVNRYGDWFDLMANVAGMSIGALIAQLVNQSILTKPKGD
ncbi:VanZ family protein [Vibrio sp. WJH972]